MIFGNIRKAEDLGYKGHNTYIWNSCMLCGKERWTEIRQGKPKHKYCSSCARLLYFREKRSTEGLLEKLGEIKIARELGYKGHNTYIQHSCAICGRKRWTEIRKKRPRHRICSFCKKISGFEKIRQEVYKHICPPHHWIVASNNVGSCKYCSEKKDFGELRKQIVFRLGNRVNEYVQSGRPYISNYSR
jgi:hypothetical protein